MDSSVLRFEDQNPSEPNSSSSKIIPKIEPKLEPLDEDSSISTTTQAPFFSYSSFFSLESNLCSEFPRISEFNQNALGYPESSAIVPIKESHMPNFVNSEQGTRRNPRRRSTELVRVTDLKPRDHRYFRGLIRRTRKLYESLRIFCIVQDEKLKNGDHKRTRTDLKASTIMKQHDLWLNCDKRVVGSIPGIQIGDVFFFRIELCIVGLHGQAQAGIDFIPAGQSSNGEPIATSIIVSGGYEDNEDAGDVIIYTGHGGQDKHNRQIVHQKLECGNLAMERSMHYGVEVRVIRGFKYKYEGSASEKVYVYDGLYRIVETWFDVGKSGFGVYKFKLVRIENQVEMGSVVMRLAKSLRIRPLEVRPNGYITLDLSRKMENIPVFLFNDIDQNLGPAYYEYVKTAIFPPYVYLHGNAMGCECIEGCSNPCICTEKNGGEIVYDMNGILVRGKPLIFECGINCRCPSTCRNRVSQNGIRHKFEVFRSRDTQWGVRSLDLIPAGSFVCEYAGVVLTREQAEIFTMNGDYLVHPSRFSVRWVEWGDLSPIFSDYVRPAHPSTPSLDFALDVSRTRNVACYVSHSSTPNVFVQLVLYDHNNVSFPHLMLFAMENIPPMQELSLDYGMVDETTARLSISNTGRP